MGIINNLVIQIALKDSGSINNTYLKKNNLIAKWWANFNDEYRLKWFLIFGGD